MLVYVEIATQAHFGPYGKISCPQCTANVSSPRPVRTSRWRQRAARLVVRSLRL